jgi:hypothetical protein
VWQYLVTKTSRFDVCMPSSGFSVLWRGSDLVYCTYMVTILYITNTGKHLCTVETFYMHNRGAQKQHLNHSRAITKNQIFDERRWKQNRNLKRNP